MVAKVSAVLVYESVWKCFYKAYGKSKLEVKSITWPDYALKLREKTLNIHMDTTYFYSCKQSSVILESGGVIYNVGLTDCFAMVEIISLGLLVLFGVGCWFAGKSRVFLKCRTHFLAPNVAVCIIIFFINCQLLYVTRSRFLQKLFVQHSLLPNDLIKYCRSDNLNLKAIMALWIYLLYVCLCTFLALVAYMWKLDMAVFLDQSLIGKPSLADLEWFHSDPVPPSAFLCCIFNILMRQPFACDWVAGVGWWRTWQDELRDACMILTPKAGNKPWWVNSLHPIIATKRLNVGHMESWSFSSPVTSTWFGFLLFYINMYFPPIVEDYEEWRWLASTSFQEAEAWRIVHSICSIIHIKPALGPEDSLDPPMCNSRGKTPFQDGIRIQSEGRSHPLTMGDLVLSTSGKFTKSSLLLLHTAGPLDCTFAAQLKSSRRCKRLIEGRLPKDCSV